MYFKNPHSISDIVPEILLIHRQMCSLGYPHFWKLFLAACVVVLLSVVYLYSKSRYRTPIALSHADPSHSLLLVASDNVPMRHVYITVRSVFLDTRLRNIDHKNASVFLIEVRKDILQHSLIIGCRIGKHATTDFKI